MIITITVPSKEHDVEHAVSVPISRYEELLQAEALLRSLDDLCPSSNHDRET